MLNSSEAEQQRRSKEIDKCLYREKTYVKRLVKILLLGAGESGKSTFLKQMRIIHGQDWDRSAREEFRATIYSNVIKGTVLGGGCKREGGRQSGGLAEAIPSEVQLAAERSRLSDQAPKRQAASGEKIPKALRGCRRNPGFGVGREKPLQRPKPLVKEICAGMAAKKKKSRLILFPPLLS